MAKFDHKTSNPLHHVSIAGGAGDPTKGHGIGHIVAPKILIATALALLVLTALTVLSVRIDFDEFDLHEMNILIALTIAVIKASLVCLFFMHLRWDRPFNGFVLVCSLSLVALFIWFAMTDTTEYHNDIIKGNSAVIQSQLSALPPPTSPPSAEHAESAPKTTATH